MTGFYVFLFIIEANTTERSVKIYEDNHILALNQFITYSSTQKVNLIKYFKMGFQKYADFSTRSTRAEFWWFQLGYFLLVIPILIVAGGVIAISLIDVIATGSEEARMTIGILLGILAVIILGTIIPQIAITVRRLHDGGQTGRMYLLIMVPYIGFVALIVFGILETQRVDNKWGPVSGDEEE